MVDELVKARIPKPTATRLVDRIDKNMPDTLANDVHWLKWVVALGFPILIGIITYLHNDMKAEIRSVRTEVKTEIRSIRTEMQSMQKEINAKIDQILLQRR